MVRTFTLTTTAFADGGGIPTSCTCDGEDRPPLLAWTNPPAGTRSFALIVDDPDAPGGTFTHWLVYDLPATCARLDEHPAGTSLPNDFGRTAYGGPCPPVGHGPHRYVFTLLAVDVPNLAVHGRTRAALERALQGHVLGTARVTGVYERRRAR
jgi:Raf kinase inhibitor-like YbhB/YbcL family protein